MSYVGNAFIVEWFEKCQSFQSKYDGGLKFKIKSWLFLFQSNPDGANNNEDSTLAPGII